MTYLAFLAVFIAPVVAVLVFLFVKRHGRIARSQLKWVGLIALLALLYTTPWDNYIVWRGVWSYGADRVAATVGFVPVEEYLFMVLQAVGVAVWFLLWLERRPLPSVASIRRGRALGITTWLAAAGAGGLLILGEQTLYLGVILLWSGPVLAGQWILGARRFTAQAWRMWAVLVVPTVYLWVVDRIAIALGVWVISDRFTTGVTLAGLPIEEAAFFLMTNALVVHGVLLFLPEVHSVAVQQRQGPAGLQHSVAPHQVMTRP
jgi:lycopene cyclase domain-containing protein